MLSPYYLSDNEEVTSWLKDGVISEEDWYRKINLPSLIQRFELENFSIEAFDKELSIGEKVRVIKSVIDTYVNEFLNKKVIDNEPIE